jgi:AraC-like DNA-binding protein
MLVRPPPDLDDWLSAGVAARFGGPCGAYGTARFPALLAGSLVLALEGRFGLHDGLRFHALPAAVLSGPSAGPVTLHHTARLRYVGLMVRPAAIGALADGLPGALAGGMVDARDAFGPAWTPVATACADTASDAAALDCLFAFIRQWRTARRQAHADAAHRLQATWACGAAEAARLQGCSTRQLERRFQQAFGLGPKRFQRVARNEAAMRHVLAGGRADAGTADRLGYFDQSHLARDLRALGGMPAATLAGLATEDDSFWPLRVGAGYAAAGIRPDFALH